MPTDDKNEDDPKSCETRFGLVMYGGVSLAIYINGVAREFFRAVRGAGVYKLMKALTDTDVVVDVISGTSAGGINGIMLAYALCNNKDFGSCASLWRLDGDVRSLLRSPYRDAERSESLFDSEDYYQPRLEAAFREMPDYVEEDGEINSPFPELDLFVTGTDVDGQISTQFDDAGHPIDVKDHRSVFLLKHRQGRKHPFEPGSAYNGPSTPDTTFKALAKLARITSCFPAAFTPVHVTSEPPGNETVDGKLQLWGGLGKDSCFLDGGVIDNKPFTYTIREIFNRAADREVERKLFYVEPDPERFDRPDVASRPNFVQAVIASLIGIPGYESIADDLRLLAKHNSKVKQYGRLRDFLEKRAGGPTPPISAQDKELYERCSLIALSERVTEGVLKVNGKAELLSRQDREAAAALIGAFDKMQEEIRGDTCLDEDALRPGDDAAKTGKEKGKGKDAVKDVPTILRNFDIYFRQRRLYRTVYKLVDVLKKLTRSQDESRSDALVQAEIDRYTNLWRILNRELELLEIVRVQMERLIDDAPINWKDRVKEAFSDGDVDEKKLKEKLNDEARHVWDIVAEGLYRLLDENGDAAKLLRGEDDPSGARRPGAFDDVREQIKKFEADPSVKLHGFDTHVLTDFNARLKRRVAEIIKEIDANKIREDVESLTDAERAARGESFRGILQIAREFEREVIGGMLKAGEQIDDDAARRRADVRSTYFDFQRLDAQMFPIEFVAELYEKDVIETIRISPRDAERGFSNKGFSDKVSGDALYHFGGFFKRSWRSNDILWGRLDSLCQLTETLLTPEKIERVLNNPLLRERARARFFTDEAGDAPGTENKPPWRPSMHPEQLFPHAGKATQESLARWLVGLLCEKKPLDREDFNTKKIARLVEAGQLEILYEDLPGVITDALEEQARWNQFRYPPHLLKPGGSEQPTNGKGTKGTGDGKFDPTVYPPVYRSARGNLDPFASVLAAAGAASDAMRRFGERPASGTTPMDTGVGQFFSKEYRIGSEALTRDMPPLVLMEILSVSLLVMRNCLLKVFGGQAARIKAHPLYAFGVDWPLRAFNTLVVFMRRVPTSQKILPAALGALSIVLLIIGMIWRVPIIWAPRTQTQPGSFSLRWFLVFIGGPAVVLTTEAVYLYQAKVRQWTWLRFLRDIILALLILLPCFVALIAYVNVYGDSVKGVAEFLKRWLAEGAADWVARGAVFVTVLLVFLAPLISFWVLARIGQWGRSRPRRLRELLQRFFSIPEMLAIARRLELFDDAQVDALARDLGVFTKAQRDEILRRSEARVEEFSDELKRKLALPEDKSEAHAEGLKKERPKIRYGAIAEVYAETERARKLAAYRKLAEDMKGIERERQDALASKLARAEEAAADKKAAAADALIKTLRDFEERKKAYAYASIENACYTNQAVNAGMILAQRLVDAAVARDNEGKGSLARLGAKFRKRGRNAAKHASEKATTLARLEDLMYSINPGAMS
jgi:patatin-related protein